MAEDDKKLADERAQRRERGQQAIRDIAWPVEGTLHGRVDPEFWEFTTETVMADIWARPGLSKRDRELITVAILVALDASEGIKPHLRWAAPALGISERELKEVIFHTMYYAGWPKGAHAFLRLQEVMNEPNHPWRKK